MSQRQRLLDQALQVSQRMGERAAEGDWEKVIELEAERSGLLERAFDEKLPADDATARQINAILAADKRLISLGVDARNAVAGELSQIQRGRKGQQAYQNAGR